MKRTTWTLSLYMLHFIVQGQLHVDMVKFAVPVKVLEVRVIPIDVKAHGNVNKLDRIG
jgi:hypothetical protein